MCNTSLADLLGNIVRAQGLCDRVKHGEEVRRLADQRFEIFLTLGVVAPPASHRPTLNPGVLPDASEPVLPGTRAVRVVASV